MNERFEEVYTAIQERAVRTWHQFLHTRTTQYVVLGVVTLCVLAVLLCAVAPPKNFPVNNIVMLPEEVSAPVLTHALVAEGILTHPDLFLVLARVSGLDTSLTGGAYIFSRPTSALGVLLRVGNGEHGITQTRVTFTEGMTVKDMREVLTSALPGFDATRFMYEASTSEGYLFPDTYFIFPGTSEKELVERFRNEFSDRVSEIAPTGQAKTLDRDEMVILASILEREARGSIDMKMVAGILYNRLARGMPLQVDAVFGYIHGKNGYTPTGADLRSDSPYNTYRNKGLPPTAIDNPGIEALTAAAQPTQSSYLYYLTGRDGKMYYARTFEEHKRNRALYLD